MKKHFKSRNHVLKMGFVATISLIWLVLRTGRKPSRIAYPCQKAAVANIHIFLVGLFAPLLYRGWYRELLFHAPHRRVVTTILLLSSLLLAFETISLTSNYISPTSDFTPVLLELKSQQATVTASVSDLFFVRNASGLEGNMDASVETLLQVMAYRGLHFFKTESQLSGLIARDDVVLLKVNCQWPYRGGTNTDLVKALIKKIVSHPEGFIGEIVIADNGQGIGQLDWFASNAYNISQTMVDVANMFVSSHKVSTYLWDSISTCQVEDYDQNDYQDGYVVDPKETPIELFYVSYPKFRTNYGTFISFKNGIWDNTTKNYDHDRLKIINLPVLKSHSHYGVTAAVKNYMGVPSQNIAPTHAAIKWGALGVLMSRTKFPILNILDAIWVNANPPECGDAQGPRTPYNVASFTNIIGASRDPVALDYWASKHILIPAAISRNYTVYNSINPDYEPLTPTPTMEESFHNYLERSMNILKNAGYRVTMNEAEMSVHVSDLIGAVHNFDSGLGYASIQEAIDAPETLNEHTIFVTAGTYCGHLIVNKPVSLFAEDIEDTIIDGNETGTVVTIIADDAEINGFTIRGGGPTISDSGIRINSSGNIISNNRVINNKHCGILLDYSSKNNTICGNEIMSNMRGCMLNHSTGNTILGNEMKYNVQEGISLWDSFNNTISGNRLSDNFKGIAFSLSENNEATQNTIVRNAFGVSLEQSSWNRLYHNDFLTNNQSQVYLPAPSGESFWDNGYPSGGNYWNENNPPDTDQDKIGDIEYRIDQNNTDKYPLIYPFHYYELGYIPESDINRDGIVNIVDIALVARAFQTVPGESKWNPKADMDISGVINIIDISMVAKERSADRRSC